MRVLLLAVALLLAAGCGSDDEPARTLSQGTLTVGIVVDSPRDREIERAARIAAAEVNDAGGIEGEVRIELVAGPVASVLAEGGARVLVLPCEPEAEARAVEAVRGRRLLTLATCASTAGPADDRQTSPWGVGPDLAARAALLAEVLRDRDVTQVELAVDQGAPIVQAALADAGVAVVPGSEALVTDAGWEGRRELGEGAYGLAALDSAAGAARAGAANEDTAFATFGFPSPGTELDELYEKVRLQYGSRPDGSHAALGYNAVRVAVEAVERSDSTDPAALADAMPGLTVAGATGILRYDEEGRRRPSADAAVVELRDGRLELVRRGRGEDG